MEHIEKTIKEKKINSSPANSRNKYLNTVNSNNGRVFPYADGEDSTSEGLAVKLAEDLDDMKSLRYYQILAKETNHQILLDTLSYTLETDRLGKIKTTKARYFMFLLKVRGIRTKFKKEQNEK
ncbi:MAG: hypothetical protein HYW63_05135 [Candidatus Levybacteria bacterium]|nr:hypothetical protein [Candidatus Levybacteria bacterium]